MAEEKKEEKKAVKTAPAKAEDKGKFIKAIGRRKTAVAQVRMYLKGTGQMLINEIPVEKYFDETQTGIATQPVKLTGVKDVDFSVIAKGGGKSAQAEATRHGISRILIAFDEEYKLLIRAKGWLTRDSRRVERKKPGLKKARRAPQWSKR